MRMIKVDIVDHFDDQGDPVYKTVKEPVYTIKELPLLKKMMECKDSHKRGINYLNIPCAFDIETTNIYKKNDKGEIITDPAPFAFMYQWQFCIDDCVTFGRTWNEFMVLIQELARRMNLSLNNRLVIYVHNLPFEWAFMNRFINYHEGFFRDDRKPLKIVTSEGIEFRCSYALSNMSLSKFCKNEIGVKHYKLVDTYDYDKIRTPLTPLTEVEEAYCYNDVRGLCECIRSRLLNDTLTTIPLTSTGYVRRDLRAAVTGDKKYRKLFRNNALDKNLYTMCRDAFRGGDTHANIDYSRQLLKNIHARDEASAYPAAMMMDLYPQTAFTKMNVSTYLNRDTSEYALLIEVIFKNLVYIGNTGIPYIPLAKCKQFTSDKIVDNGRVIFASLVQMTITDIDLEIIKREYLFDDILMRNIYASVYAPLSDKIKNVVLDYFRKKTLLKGDPDSEYEYNKSKNNLNSTYGCMVMRIDQHLITYDDTTHEYNQDDTELEELLSKFYKSRNSFLSYQHGVWITANARLRLRKMLWEVGSDVVYCDTDSIKFRGDHENTFEDKNKILIEAAIKAGAYAETKKGKVKYMGIWEDECKDFDNGVYDEFKTLGSKKYVYSATKDGKKEVISTIAGVNKSKGSKYFKDHGIKSFDIGTTLFDSGHLTAFYNDDNIHEITIDHCKFLTASNLALIDNTYKIGVTGEYLYLLEQAIANREDLEYI